MTAQNRTTLKGYFNTGDVPTEAQFANLIDSFPSIEDGITNTVVTSVTGTLTVADHSGHVLVTSGNVTVPTTAGFQAIIVAGGAHTVSFNSTTSAAMATGDIMTVIVESSTVIHAVLTAAANKVSFT